MSTEEIVSKLQSMGIAFEKEVFLREVEEFYSAQQLSENWFEIFSVSATNRDEDFPWVAAWVLWERLCFPNEKELIIHNMRRSIADSYIHLKKIDEAKRELDSLVSDYPGNPWSYIAYGDMYWFGKNIFKDTSKAKEFYERALLFAKDEYDKKAIEERLEDIKD